MYTYMYIMHMPRVHVPHVPSGGGNAGLGAPLTLRGRVAESLPDHARGGAAAGVAAVPLAAHRA